MRGVGSFVTRAEMPELFSFPQIIGDLSSIFHLTVSEDGKTATLDMVKAGNVRICSETATNVPFGSFVVHEEVTIDIDAEVPVVTGVRLAQTISDVPGLAERYMQESDPNAQNAVAN